jgi:hypothetical protein
MLGLRKLCDVVACVLERDERATARQRDWIVKRPFPAALSHVAARGAASRAN